jgi:hypothetical protein
MASKRVSKNRKININHACFNLWHEGRNYAAWIHILMFSSIVACINREESWGSAWKSMTH